MPKAKSLFKVESGGVIARLNGLAQRARANSKFAFMVGYTAPYAVYVHENLTARHPVGQAKFLEQPAREHADEIAAIIMRALRAGLSPRSALGLGAIRLLQLSKPLVPVDTGFLKASGYAKVETKGAT